MHAVSYAFGREEVGTILGILKPSYVSASIKLNCCSHCYMYLLGMVLFPG